MGWTVPTYSGVKATGTVSNWRQAMFELCRGINQRQAAIATTKTQFYKEDGTLGSDLALSDFLDMRISGSLLVYNNLEKIRGAVNALVGTGKFVTTDGGDTVWNTGTVATAIGHTNTDVPDKATEAQFWQIQQDTLDLLIYCKFKDTVVNSTATLDIRSHFPATATTPNAAWTDALADSPTSAAVGPGNEGVRHTLGFNGTVYTAAIADNVQGGWVYLDYGGALTKFYYDYYVYDDAGSIGTDLPSIDIMVNSTTFASGVAYGSSGHKRIDRELGANVDLDITGGTTYVNYTASHPSTAPWTPPNGPSDSKFVVIDAMTIYTNLTSALTDQA